MKVTRTAPAPVALPPIAPPGNEVPRVLRELRFRARGRTVVMIPAELALQLAEALEAGILVGAEVEQLKAGTPMPAIQGFDRLARAIDALRQWHPRN